MQTNEATAVGSERERPPIELARLAVGFYFKFVNDASGQIWQKTGRRSARPCQHLRRPVKRFRGWELVRWHELKEEAA